MNSTGRPSPGRSVSSPIPAVGIEPTRGYPQRILSPQRLPQAWRGTDTGLGLKSVEACRVTMRRTSGSHGARMAAARAVFAAKLQRFAGRLWENHRIWVAEHLIAECGLCRAERRCGENALVLFAPECCERLGIAHDGGGHLSGRNCYEQSIYGLASELGNVALHQCAGIPENLNHRSFCSPPS